MSSSGLKVDVVETGTGTHHDFQVLGSVEHLGVNLVGTDNQGIGIGHGCEQLRLVGIFLQQSQGVACTFHFLADALDSSCCEGFLCSDKYFHDRNDLVHFLKLLHAVDESLHTFHGLCVVAAGAESTH